jgi:uncharacterized protein (TIGR02147 family)
MPGSPAACVLINLARSRGSTRAAITHSTRDIGRVGGDNMTSETIPRRRCPIDVFAHLDYRSFLAEYYKAKKERGFSYRAFSRMARLGAPNYLKLVILGQRNLTPAMAARFAAACGLQGDAALFFERLVEFNQATNAKQRQESYAKLGAFRRYRHAQKLELAQAEYHAHWYLPAIRELCSSPAFVADPKWIARSLVPPISVAEARKALDLLLDLGLLERSEDGRLQQRAAVLSTGPQTRGMHITNYHAEMMRRATAAMELVPAAQRDISSLTLCLDAEGLEQLKQRLQLFRRELIEFAEQQREPQQAVQLNLQLFPLSTRVSPPRHENASSRKLPHA